MPSKKSSPLFGAVAMAYLALSPYATLATDTDINTIKKGVGVPKNKLKAGDSWIKKPDQQAMDAQKGTQKAATQKATSKLTQQPKMETAKSIPPKASAGAGKPASKPQLTIKEQAELNKQVRIRQKSERLNKKPN
ncbi:MAG: hypothetical protein K0R52_1323 [Alphaproteobacteria bacterium]|jgi:hypothetical protein|nr:hypothetical protein [Alphaproteobacteria bacterium]